MELNKGGVLKVELRRQLNEPRISRRKRAPKVCRVDVRCGRAELRVIEEIEEFKAQLDTSRLCELGVFHQREIKVVDSHSVEVVPTRVSNSPISRALEGIGVEEIMIAGNGRHSGDVSREAAGPRINQLHWRNNVRPIRTRVIIIVRAVQTPQAGVIHVDGEARLERRDSGNSPTCR